MTRPASLAPLGRAAIAYAEHMRPVFPCLPRAKEPRLKHGFKEATTDVHVVFNWWRRWPDANIGLVAGATAGFFVLDVDPRNGGDESLRMLQRTHDRLPRTRTARTGSGGWHVLFRFPTITGQWRGKLDRHTYPGLDIKVNGYIIAAPSIHPCGAAYRWVNNADLAAPPTWLVSLATVAPPPVAVLPRAQRLEDNAVHRARCYVARMPPAVSGSGGHDATFRVALVLMRGFDLAHDAAYELLVEYNARCEPPWSERELRHKLKQAAENSALPVGYMLEDEAERARVTTR